MLTFLVRPPQQPTRVPCADRSFIIPYYYGTAARTRTPALLSVFTSQMLISCTAQPDLQALNASMTLAYVLTSAFSVHYLLTLLTDTFFPMGRIAPLMVSRLILNLRGADDAQKNHMRLSGIGSDHSAKRGTLGACGFSPLDGETLTLLFVFLCLVPGPNQRHRYSCVPHSCIGD